MSNLNVPETVQFKQRALYQFRCTGCGKSRRETLKLRRLKDGLCATCRKNAPVPGQLKMN